MHKHRIIAIFSCAALILAGSFTPAVPAHASISSCSATITPHTVTPGSTTDFTLDVTNNDPDNDIQYVHILRPSSDFTILSATNPSWDSGVAPDEAVLQWGDITAPDTETFTVQAEVANVEADAASWTVFASDDGNGSGSRLCTSDTAVAITNGAPFQVSDATVSAITATTATVTYTTNYPGTTVIDYGATSSYGSTATGDPSDFQTSHSFKISGLSPSTAYHYKASSTSDTGATAASGDNTFVTPAAPASTSGASTPGVNVPGAIVKTIPTETVPPTISLATNFAKPFTATPLIQGEAADNDAVARIEYSTDGGQNWLPVGQVTRMNGAAKVAFSFTPVLIDDGNYSIVARATDTSGNTAATPAATLVIDRLPPQLGPTVIAYGPETLVPDASGAVSLLAGSDYRISASAIGGPTVISLEARPTGGATASASFALTQSADSGRWNGVMSFKDSGTYQVVAKSLDGAGNRTTRTVMNVAVAPAGRITAAGSQAGLAGATVTLYYREPASQTWTVWAGAPYGQTNPQRVAADGRYSLVAPAGTYYLRVQAPRYHGFISDIFTIHQPRAIASVIALSQLPRLTLGPFTIRAPDLVFASRPLPASKAAPAAARASKLVGMFLPHFDLPTVAGGHQRALDFTGKPTVLTILATWSPDSQAQLGPLAAAQANHDVNVVPVFSQERPQLVAVYLATAGFDLAGLVDTDGVLVAPLQIGPVPEHLFVDRDGRIKKVVLGVLSKDELLSQLGGL